MPEYKKKNFSKKSLKKKQKSPEKKIKKSKDLIFDDNIAGINKPVRVVKGKKYERKRKFRILISAAAFITALNILLTLILPVSLAENITNLVSSLGTGSYPISLSGLQTLDSRSTGLVYYILSDTGLTAYNKGGKEVYHRMCGYENPVLKTSATRALVYDQGGSELSVSNLKKVTNTYKSENSIICADIGRNGTYAVVTSSSEYASTVTVFNKNSKRLYTWNSAKEIINNICISDNGKSIAVSGVTVSSGKYVTHTYILSFDSADPVFTQDLEGKVTLYMKSAGRYFYTAASDGYVSFTNWKSHKSSVIKKDYELAFCRNAGNKNIFVFNLLNNKNENIIVYTDNSGKILSEFKIEKTISDIEIYGSHIYCISDTRVSVYSKDGTLLRDGSCGYGCKRFSVTGTYSVAVITDSEITEFDIPKKEK